MTKRCEALERGFIYQLPVLPQFSHYTSNDWIDFHD